MGSAWLDVPLADYEGHMAHVGQAPLLDRLFADALAALQPRSVAVLGAAGGNGFGRLSGAAGNRSAVQRVVAVDINSRYLAELERRYRPFLAGLEIVCGDVADAAVDFAPVDYVHAALFFEYVDAAIALARIRRWLAPGGSLGVVLQLPGAPGVSPSPFTSLAALHGALRLCDEARFLELASAAGFTPAAREAIEMPGGKRFAALRFTSGQPRQNG